MTIPRRLQISLDQTPYYHCISRCVRRAHLCGRDQYTKKNYDHRKQWLEDRIALLSQIFAIEILAYAIMDNHYHIVVRIDASAGRAWSDEEVTRRWGSVYAVPDFVTSECIAHWRERLCSLSWFMRTLNEPLARMANKEDDCTGRFWEGRFKCQALLDEAALVRCMAYVDLNPIRAAITSKLETSAHTSIAARLHRRDQHLAPFTDTAKRNSIPIPIRQRDYFELVDWTGRQLRLSKRGRIPVTTPMILAQLNIKSDRWLGDMRHFGRWYYRAVGSPQALEQYCQKLGQNWLKGKVRLAELAT